MNSNMFTDHNYKGGEGGLVSSDRQPDIVMFSDRKQIFQCLVTDNIFKCLMTKSNF